MSRFKNNISTLFFGIAVLGTMLSMVHYHSDGLECISHANEQHYTENELVCPVCAVVAYTDTGESTSLSDILEFEETVIDVQPLYLSVNPFVSILGRAPPLTI